MALHIETCLKIDNKELCEAICKDLERNFSRLYIERKYDLSRQELQRIIYFYVEHRELLPN